MHAGNWTAGLAYLFFGPTAANRGISLVWRTRRPPSWSVASHDPKLRVIETEGFGGARALRIVKYCVSPAFDVEEESSMHSVVVIDDGIDAVAKTIDRSNEILDGAWNIDLCVFRPLQKERIVLPFAVKRKDCDQA